MTNEKSDLVNEIDRLLGNTEEKHLVKVRYFSDTTGELSGREYTYYSEEKLATGDVIRVPVRDTTAKAQVSAVDVSESEIAAFKDKVKVIPAGSLVKPTLKTGKEIAEKMPVIDDALISQALRNLEEQNREEEETEEERLGNDPFPEYPPEFFKELEELEGIEEDSPAKHAKHDNHANTANVANHDIPAIQVTHDIPATQVELTIPLTGESVALVTIKVRPEDDPRVLALASESEKLRQYALARVITADADLKPATEDLSIIARVKKALTEAKAEYVKPIRSHLDEVAAAFARILTPLEEADKLTRSKIIAYRQEQERRAREADEINRQKEELARREAQFNGTGEITINTDPLEAPEPVHKVQTGLGTASTMKIKKWELVDFKAVPDECKMLDSTRITRIVKAGGSIPGIRVWTEDSLRVNTR